MDPAKMKVVDLRSELGALGLDTKGNKPALVERLRKALEAKTGKATLDSTILDTSTEEVEEAPTPRRAAARTTRRSSSGRAPPTPAKQVRVEPEPEPIVEEKESPPESASEPEPEPEPVREKSPSPEPAPSPPPVAAPQPVPAPVPAPAAAPEPKKEAAAQPEHAVHNDDLYSIDDDKRQSPGSVKEESPDRKEDSSGDTAQDKEDKEDKMDQDGDKRAERPLTEEEEWAQLNERLQQREAERLERERKQAEADAKRLEELANDPVRLNRLKRKHEKKQRWSNFYRSVEVTNEVLVPPSMDEPQQDKNKKDNADLKIPEPEELDDNKVTLSWYDSDLNQYLELPELRSVVPLSEGAFAHAWAGARATHGVTSGRVCFEVRVGAVVTTTEAAERDVVSAGLRVGWSTDDSTLHLGEGEFSWGVESTGRLVHNGEFKDYTQEFKEKDVIGAYLDLESSPALLSFTLNGAELGPAFELDREALGDKALFPHILTRNMCYTVNFGYDRYNMITRTKIVRKRIEIPVEQVLEEKRKKEEEIQKQKEEAIRKEKERKEREKKERDERLRKKREERERLEREKKEKEAEEKRQRGEDAPNEEEGKKEDEEMADKSKEAVEDGEKQDKEEPQENGDKTEEGQAEKEDKPEAMEVDAQGEDKPRETTEENEEAPAAAAPEGEIPEVTEEQVLKGHVLDKRIKFVIRFTVDEELDGEEAQLLEGYTLIAHYSPLVPGPRRPDTVADCEVILMVGMPGAGKTHWARAHAAAHPARRYNILSTGALFDNMKVDCKPFRASYEGRWDAMVSKCAKCVLKLLEIAKGRRRNFILDQTNVYPSAQRRKLRDFPGHRRAAVVVVPPPDEARRRAAERHADGKDVPDGAVMDMKANFTLPEKCAWLDEVIYAELDEEEARKVVEQFHKEAKAAGVVRERERRDRSGSRDGRDAPPAKRARDDERKRRDDRRPRDGFNQRPDREDRWGGGGGGGGGGRWGPARGGGMGPSRWGGGGGPPPRDTRPPGGRFDRWGPPQGGRDFGGGRDRDGFRGGRGGGRGDMRGDRAGGRGGGPGGPPGGPQRFGRDDRNSRPPPTGPQGGGGGAGSWQRGGGGQMAPHRGGMARSQGAPYNNRQQKDGQNQQNQQQQQGWNQWAGGWGGWGNWNQNPGWGQWGNWGNWGNANAAAGQGAGAGAGAAGAGTGAAAAGGKGQQAGAGGQQAAGQQAQWPAGYTAQQWYQWQQWQQQQQGWPGYQGNQQTSAADAQQAWAQYYQSYGANAANAAQTQGQSVEKK